MILIFVLCFPQKMDGIGIRSPFPFGAFFFAYFQVLLLAVRFSECTLPETNIFAPEF